MAGILANSASATMVSGDTAVDKSVGGRVLNEQITLTAYPTGTTYAWSQSIPAASATAKSALSASTGTSVTFTPDAAGVYTITANVDGTTYTIRITVLSVNIAESASALRFSPVANVTIPTPAENCFTLFNSTSLGSPAVKDDAGDVFPLALEGGPLVAAGDLYFSTPIETSIALTQTYYKALGTTTLAHQDNVDDNSVSNRLRYTGTTTGDFQVMAAVSMTGAGNNKTLRVGIAKNGTLVASSAVERFVSTGADVGSVTCQCIISLDQNDYVELFVGNWTDDTNCTVTLGNLSIHAIH